MLRSAAPLSLLVLLAAALLGQGCGQRPVTDRDGAEVGSVTPSIDERGAQIEVLVRAMTTVRRDGDTTNAMRPRAGVGVSLTGPAGSEVDETTTTGADGRARFELARSLSRLYALKPGTYTIKVEGDRRPEQIELSPEQLDRLIVAGERRLLEKTGPSVGSPRAFVDARFHPPGRPLADRDLLASPPTGGDTIELTVTARNIGNGPLYRLVGTVEARGPAGLRRVADGASTPTRWFAPVELAFGQLIVGESATLVLPITIPRSAMPGPLDVVMTWTEHNGHAPEDTRVQLRDIVAAEEPRVAVASSLARADGSAAERLAIPVGQDIRYTVEVTPRNSPFPGDLVLRLDTEPGEPIAVIVAEAAAPEAQAGGPVEMGPLIFRMDRPRTQGRMRASLVDPDFGVIWYEFIDVGSVLGDR